jgi:outer membrane protein assembly factor BamB
VAVSNITVAATIHSNAIWVCGTSGTGWALYCFEARDGKLRWRVPVPEPLPAPVVVTDRDEIIGLCDNGYTYAWDGREGRKLWEYQHADSRTRSGNGVVLRENADAILVNHTGDVICLDARTGQPKWRCPVKEPVAGKPVLADLNLDGVADVIVGTMSRRVYCISGTGAGRLWSYEVGAPIRYCTPAIVTAPRQPQPRLAVGTGPPENALYCLSGSAPPAQSRDWTGPWREVLPR